MASKGYGAIALTGGGTGALDKIDGSILNDGDVAKVTDAVNDIKYEYTLNASSGAAESSPLVISPDNNAGTKRWVLTSIVASTLTLASGTSINEFSTDGTLSGNSDNAAPTEKAVKTYTDNVTTITPHFPGLVQRSKFSWKDADEIYIESGVYHHQGTTEQLVYWDSQITFVFQSGGSNTLSSDWGADGWHYIYLDDSAIITQASPLLDADCFQNLTGANEAPTWTVAKHGWYGTGVGTAETNDRCIFAVYETGNAITEFEHDGGEYVQHAAGVATRALATLTTNFADMPALRAPSFSTKVRTHFVTATVDGDTTFVCRVNGQADATGFVVGKANADIGQTHVNMPVYTDTSQLIECKEAGATNNTYSIDTYGWYFPVGM